MKEPKNPFDLYVVSLCVTSVFLLRGSPFLMVAVVVVFFWAFNFYRRRVTGVWSNFQPLLTGFVLLIIAACSPSAWQFFAERYDAIEPSSDRAGAALGALYLIALVLILQVAVSLNGNARVGVRTPKPKRRTSPGHPFDGEELER